MARAYAYPADLARYVEAHWPSGPAALTLSRKLLEQALSIAFQASLTLEENRLTRFRLLLTPAEKLPEDGVPNQGVLRLKFDRSRPLNADELRRLSPAVPFETSLIGAHEEQHKLRIWGIAHSGPAWLAPSWGGRTRVPNWTYDPIVHVSGPGKIAVRTAGKLVGAIERGLLVDTAMDVFDSEWLPGMFEREREEVRAQHDALQVQAASPTSVEHSLVGRLGQHLIRRAIQVVRNAQHGGLILVVSAGGNGNPDAKALHGLSLKYQLGEDEPARRYRTLQLQILETVAADTSNPTAGWSDFVMNPSPQVEKLEQALFELSRVIGNLAMVDGAVVLDKRFALLGFGAEVAAELQSPQHVWRALDAEGREREAEDVENVGTRHRAAYRFVNDHPDGLAIVVSQDGGVTFVANRDGEVVFWEQSVSP